MRQHSGGAIRHLFENQVETLKKSHIRDFTHEVNEFQMFQHQGAVAMSTALGRAARILAAVPPNDASPSPNSSTVSSDLAYDSPPHPHLRSTQLPFVPASPPLPPPSPPPPPLLPPPSAPSHPRTSVPQFIEVRTQGLLPFVKSCLCSNLLKYTSAKTSKVYVRFSTISTAHGHSVPLRIGNMTFLRICQIFDIFRTSLPGNNFEEIPIRVSQSLFQMIICLKIVVFKVIFMNVQKYKCQFLRLHYIL